MYPVHRNIAPDARYKLMRDAPKGWIPPDLLCAIVLLQASSKISSSALNPLSSPSRISCSSI